MLHVVNNSKGLGVQILLFLLKVTYSVLCLVAHSCLTLCGPMDSSPPGLSVHGDSPGKKTGLDWHALLQGIFPTQGSNPGLPHCEQILYHLSHQGNPRILEWVAYPFSRGSSWPRNQTGVSCIGRPILYQLSYQRSPYNNMYELKKLSNLLSLSFLI